MAIDLLAQYPGKVNPVVPAWPYGEPRNITAPGDGLGTPWEAALAKDIVGLQQALLKSGGIVPSGTPDEVGTSQYLQTIIALASGRAFTYDESGVADAYVLDIRTNQQFSGNLFDGLLVTFTPVNGNAGASTLDYDGTIDNILRQDGTTVLTGGELPAGIETTLKFNGTNWVLASDTITDIHTFSSVGAASDSADAAIAHGLGTDDIDFGMKITGSTNLLIEAALVDTNGFETIGRTSVGVTNLATAPTPGAVGNLVLRARNGHSSSQDIIVHWWARKR